MQRQQDYSRLDIYQPQQRSAIVTGEDGKLYRVEELSPTELRHQVDCQRSRQASQIGWIVLAIGGMFVGIAGLLILGSVLAAATRPAPPPAPVTNPKCIAFCGG